MQYFTPYSQFCNYSVNDVHTIVIDRLESMDIPVFCTINHSQNARNIGLEMPETRVIVFGNPIVGTPLMLMHPDIALDLPLKILLRETPSGCELLYTYPETLAARYSIDPMNPELQKISIFLKKLCTNI